MNNLRVDYENSMSQYAHQIQAYFIKYRNELLFCIHQQVSPALINESLLSSLSYSNYGFDVERLFENTDGKVPFIEAIVKLKSVTKVSDIDDVALQSHVESYKQSSFYSRYLNQDGDQSELAYVMKDISINGKLYSLHYRLGTQGELYYRIESEGIHYCLNDYQYIQLAKGITKNEDLPIHIEHSGDLFLLDKKNTQMSIQQGIYNLLLRHFNEQGNQEIVQTLGTYGSTV